VQNRADIAFYMSAATEFGEPVLELGCGSGRVALAVLALASRSPGWTNH
jgi:predicted RNA methylase